MSESRNKNPEETADRPVFDGQPMFKGDFEERDHEE
jgi:hypothetical protein